MVQQQQRPAFICSSPGSKVFGYLGQLYKFAFKYLGRYGRIQGKVQLYRIIARCFQVYIISCIVFLYYILKTWDISNLPLSTFYKVRLGPYMPSDSRLIIDPYCAVCSHLWMSPCPNGTSNRNPTYLPTYLLPIWE